jgi:hypothetical protein
MRTCGSQPVAPARAKIIFDLRLMSVGPFLKALSAAIFRGYIHSTALLDLVKVDHLEAGRAAIPQGNEYELSF